MNDGDEISINQVLQASHHGSHGFPFWKLNQFNQDSGLSLKFQLFNQSNVPSFTKAHFVFNLVWFSNFMGFILKMLLWWITIMFNYIIKLL